MHYQFDAFTYDTQRAQLTGPDGEIALRPITLSVLRHLLENPLRVVSHEELLDKVWGRQAVSIGVLSQSIRELRQALGDSARNSTLIETKHKLGYCLLIEPSLIKGGNGDGAALSPHAQSKSVNPGAGKVSPSLPQSRPWRFGPILLVVLIAVPLTIVVWRNGYLASSPAARSNVHSQEILHDGRPREPEARSWYSQGLDALEAGNMSDARVHFENVLKREPDAVAALTGLADTMSRAGNLAQARVLAGRALELSASLPRTSQLRVQAFAATLAYQRADAISALQALYQLDRGDADSGFRLTEALLGAGRVADAGNVIE